MVAVDGAVLLLEVGEVVVDIVIRHGDGAGRRRAGSAPSASGMELAMGRRSTAARRAATKQSKLGEEVAIRLWLVFLRG